MASESTDQVWVLEGEPLSVVARIDVGRLPHNISVSPDGRWVAVANRMGNSVSVIEPREIREVARVPVGRQPHEIIWSPDSRTIFVGSERDAYIWRIEAETWRLLPPLAVGVPQHTMAIWSGRPTELWFTLTNTNAQNHLRVYHLDQNRVEPIDVSDVHDVYFMPDGTEVWSSSSGFIGKPSDRMVIYDVATKRVKEEIRLPGRYPFHTIKHNRDATFFVDQGETIVLSDHEQGALVFVDWRRRSVTGEVRLGPQPFHSAYTPGRYYTTTNLDDSLRVIDVRTREVIHRVSIPRPHGVVFVPLPNLPRASENEVLPLPAD